MRRSDLARTGFVSTSNKWGRYHFDIDLFTRETSDFILPYLQIELVIGDGLITIGTTIGKLLNHLFFQFRLLIASISHFY